VFERFYRVDQARSRNTGGSGLGLSIVKHTVQNHGGDVRVWSQPGRGSTFMIRLPVADAPAVTEDDTVAHTAAAMPGAADVAAAALAARPVATNRGERT
jgi:two-component system sensor histidine kinase SenX3